MNKQLKEDLLSGLSDKDIYKKYPFIKDIEQLTALYFKARG